MSKHSSVEALFSAPYAFLPEVVRDYQSVLSTEFHEIWDREQVPAFGNYSVWIPNPGQHFVIDASLLTRFPALRLIVTPSTGSNHIDREACASHGIRVRSLLDARDALDRIAASAEFTFLLLLNALRRVDIAVGEVTARRMRRREDILRGRELQGLRVGVVGLGRIGRRVSGYCSAFGASTVYHDPFVIDDNVPSLGLAELFASCDVVCVCCTLTDSTRGMVGYDLLRSLPTGAVFVNTSRGEVVVESDLLRVLDERPDLRVALDVLDGEVHGRHVQAPILALHDTGRLVVTPHVAGATVESQEKAARAALTLVQQELAYL